MKLSEALLKPDCKDPVIGVTMMSADLWDLARDGTMVRVRRKRDGWEAMIPEGNFVRLVEAKPPKKP